MNPHAVQLDMAGVITFVIPAAIETKVRRIGNSLGIMLPKEALHQMKVEEGATLYLTGDAEGAMRLTPDRPGFKEKMAIAKEGMNRYRNALRELAK